MEMVFKITTRLGLALMLWVSLAAPAPKAQAKGEEGSVELTPVVIQHMVQSVYAGPLTGADGATVRIKSRSFTFRKSKQGAWTVSPGGDLPPEGKTFEIGDRHVAIYFDALGRPQCFGADGLKGEIAGVSLVFLDGNLDGDYFDEGEDYVIAGEAGRFAFPYYRVMPFPDGLYTFVVPSGRTLKFTRQALGLPDEAKTLYTEFNKVRMDFGLFPTQCDPVFSMKCQAHADYMKKNDVCSHDEVVGKPGYSKAGAEAGASSVVTPGGDVKESVFSLWDTPLHGWDLRAAWFTQSAFGSNGGYAAIRTVGVKSRAMAMPCPVVFPPNDAHNVPVSWRGENPEARVDPKKGNGYPFTFYFRWGTGLAPKLTVKLEQQDGDKWKALNCQVTYNGATASKETRDYFGNDVPAFALPDDALLPNTVYRLTFSIPGAGKEMINYVSCFTTGSAQGQDIWDTTQGN